MPKQPRLLRRKIHVVSFVIDFVKVHIATAVTAQIIGDNNRPRRQAKAVSKIFAKQGVVVRRMDAFPMVLSAGADDDFSVIGQNGEMRLSLGKKASVIHI